MQWQKSLGGSNEDEANSIQQTSDSGFIVAGYSISIDGDVSGNHGLPDYWIVKLDSIGNIQWQESLGGSNYDYANSILQASDSGYIIAGGSSSNDGDITGHHGSQNFADFWIVKLSYDIATGISSVQKSFSLSPNPVTSVIQIHLPSNQKTTLAIFNLLGEKMREEKISGEDATIDVSELPQGMYLVRTEKEAIGKFVKE